MVVKRQCTFCAGEVEPGTGTMFVKRDGSVFFFCSSSCRKQQLHLGRVGHRLKWTRAHTLKRAAAQAGPRADRVKLARAAAAAAAKAPAPATAPAKADTAPAAAPATPAPSAAAEEKKPASEKPAPATKTAKPRAKKPKTDAA